MIRLNIHEAKTHLSRYLANLEEGDVILLCRRNVPVAEIRPLPRTPPAKRPIGFLRGKFSVPPSFLEPLSDDVLESFEGSSK